MAAQGKGALMDEIVSTELRPYERSRTSIEGPKIMLDPKLALSMALILHELATNAAKYGALSSPQGRVTVQWLAAAGAHTTVLTVEWHESGGPLVSPPAARGFGLRLLGIALEQFGGVVDPVFEPAGLMCRMRVPLPADTHPPPDEARETLPLNERSGPSLTPGHPFAQA
jgi:two-component sensor histidine kinase